MAKKRKQFYVGIIHVNDLQPRKNEYVFDEKNYDVVFSKSKKVLVSENRMFRMFCKQTEMKKNLLRGEDGRIVRNDDGEKMHRESEVASAVEFTVLNLNNAKERAHTIETVLSKGYLFLGKDGSETRQKRVVRSSSQVRVHKAVFTSLDVEEVRDRIGYGAKFPEQVIIAQMEARYGLGLSATIELTERVKIKGKIVERGMNFTFDIMPDFSIEREHDIKVWDEKQNKLVTIRKDVRKYEPLDGQGTMLPSAAVRASFSLQIISRRERDYLLEWLEFYNEDVRQAVIDENEEFLKSWHKIPSAFQVRFGFAKGLLVVYAHNLESVDCYGRNYRSQYELDEEGKWARDDKGNVDEVKGMEFMIKKGDAVLEMNEEEGVEEYRRYYDFSRDIMFTDSMWKANFDPRYLLDADSDVPEDHRARFEIVLWQKNRKNETVFMGYQYWQALPGIDVKPFAARKVKELKDTIFTDWKEALLFLGQYDTGRDSDDYEEKVDEAAGKIQKVILALNENPEVIQERWIQEVIRDTREKYIQDMAGGRIPVEGANPYIISPVECQFGRKSELKKKQYYYNGKTDTYTLFRSPLIHKSEVVNAKTVDVEAYHGFFKDILIINPYDDTLPRMGGASL